MKQILVLTGIAAVSLAACARPDAEMTPDAADYVFTNAKVYTSDQVRPWAEAVAVRGTDIVAVGSNEDVAKLAGPETESIDLNGKVLMPGIISTHEHPMAVMALASGGTLTYSRDADTMLEELAAYVEANPDGPYFTFGGANENTVPITREKIDAVISDRPFLMIASTGHGGWVNSAGLEALGVVQGEPDPIDSFERDASGVPTGNIPSSAAVLWALVELDLLTKEGIMEQADGIFDFLAELGVTAVYDAGQPVGTEEMLFSAMEELEAGGALKTRIMGSILTQRAFHLEQALEKLEKYGPMYTSELFNINTLKLHGGSPDGYTSALIDPYSDRPGHTGEVPYTPEEQAEAAIAAAEMGFDVHTHAMGDKNILQALDTYQAVREAGFTETRLSTGHTSLVYPEQRARYKELDVTANTFGLRNTEPEPTIDSRFGPERVQYHQPMKSFIDLGVRLTGSADWPTAPLDPFKQMTVMMTRSNPAIEESRPPASEVISLEEALRAYTIDAAYQIRLEEITGSIEVGKRADLIVLDRDIFDLTPDEVWDTQVLFTMMNGNVVFRVEDDEEDEEEYDEFDELEMGVDE